MSKAGKPGRHIVQPRPSRIRRDPPARPIAVKPTALADVAEREAWTVVTGVLLFAAAITIIIIGVSDYLSR